MPFYIYALYSKKGNKIYIGQTGNLQRRLLEHQTGLGGWTSQLNDWKIIYSETLPSRSEARKKENYFKTGKGRSELKNILSRDRAIGSSPGP